MCALAGCGGSGGDQQQPAAAGPTKPKEYKLEDLPRLEDYLPTLDDGRVEIAGPAGWNVMSRKEGYLARFAAKSGSAPPRVLVTVEPAPSGNPGNVTQGTLDQFEAFIKPIVDASLLQEEQLREPVKMLILGERPWARYVRGGRFKSMAVDRQFLKTIAGGRIYTVELQVYRGNLLEHRDAAYVIAAGMKFLKPDATGGPVGEGTLDDLLGDDKPGGDEEGGAGGDDPDAEEGENGGTDPS
jgi:hypothetical protein